MTGSGRRIYKLQKKAYPDSLEQLLQFDKLAFISDPISATDDVKFYYQRLDTGYILFSTGIDETPFTNDDIFPSVDAVGIGLIRYLEGKNR